jgi:hypothetical protein
MAQSSLAVKAIPTTLTWKAPETMTHSDDNTTDAVLAKSASKALQWLGCAGADQLVVLGLSDQGATHAGESMALTPQSRNAALQLIQIYKTVYAAVGGNQAQGQVWMSSHNQGLDEIPLHLLGTSEGRVQLLNYLEQSGGMA